MTAERPPAPPGERAPSGEGRPSAERTPGELARAVAGWAVPFLLVLYLGLQNGGYHLTVHGEVGIVIWWVVLVGAVTGMVGFARIRRAGWLVVAALAAVVLWTGLGIAWSESAERSVSEFARAVTYLGVFLLALALQGREGLRRTIGAVGAAIAVIGILAVLSRLQPNLLPDAGEAGRELGGAFAERLNYPLNYWNGLAALMAIGIPLLLTLALRARSLIGQALAAAAVPALALAAFYTLSRGGAIALAIALVALIAIYPRRLSALPTLAITGLASTLVIIAANQRDALETGLITEAAERQGNEMLAILLVACAAVGGLQVLIGLARRRDLGPRIEIPPRFTAALAGGAAVLAVVVAIGVDLPSTLDREWQEFKRPVVESEGASRFGSSSGSGRYQTWEAAIEANETERLTGLGPGTFEFWYAREGSPSAFLRDAHSLYLETLAELGIVGFLLVVGFVAAVIGLGLSRAIRASEEKRALLAGATAACAAFATSAAIDWVWELAVVPCAFLLLAAAVAGPKVVRVRTPGSTRSMAGLLEQTAARRRVSPIAVRSMVAGGAVAAMIAVAIPYAGARALDASREAARAGDIDAALDAAETAGEIQPYAASPALQEALLLEERGDLDAAAASAREATRNEATNWRPWMVLSRIEAKRGRARDAVDAYLEASSLNPRSPLFAS